MITYPNPKLNLGLNVIRKREDGYHDLESLFVPYMGMKDILEIVPAKELGMHLYGIALDGDPLDNLCIKAWKLLNEAYGIPPVEIHLCKNIPAGAGLGGGSADCAFTLRMLSDMFGLGLSDETLAGFAARLGSDCPFFVYNRPMIASGRGEILEPYDIDLSGYRIEVVKPDVHVSTKEAYAGIKPHKPEVGLREALAAPVKKWKDILKNDFEVSVFTAHPEIAAAKAAMYERGAVYASMSGSGSAVFGIF